MSKRLAWPDVVKGLSILWIVYFHGFKEYAGGRLPRPLEGHFWAQMCGGEAGLAALGCVPHGLFVAFSYLGYHAVGVFILLSGFTLAMTQTRRANRPADWPSWYRSRLLRLFPLYWVAHALYLVSPGYDPIDYRFLLSLLGNRLYPLDMPYYANPAWWYFGLLLQLYGVFPLLFAALQRWGAIRFVVGCTVIDLLSRYLVLFPLASAASGALVGGALFTCRLAEFAAGMVLGALAVQQPQRLQRLLTAPLSAVLGAVAYGLGLLSYASNATYIFSDALIGCGLGLLMIWVALRLDALPRLSATVGRVGAYSYGLYLFHQPFIMWLAWQLVATSLPIFVACAAITTALLAWLSMRIEIQVNAAVERAIG